MWLQCLLYGVLGNRTVQLWELAANKVECSLMCGKTFVDEAILVCDDGGGLLTGASSGVQSRRRDSCVQKLPLATLETLPLGKAFTDIVHVAISIKLLLVR